MVPMVNRTKALQAIHRIGGGMSGVKKSSCSLFRYSSCTSFTEVAALLLAHGYCMHLLYRAM